MRLVLKVIAVCWRWRWWCSAIGGYSYLLLAYPKVGRPRDLRVDADTGAPRARQVPRPTTSRAAPSATASVTGPDTRGPSSRTPTARAARSGTRRWASPAASCRATSRRAALELVVRWRDRARLHRGSLARRHAALPADALPRVRPAHGAGRRPRDRRVPADDPAADAADWPIAACTSRCRSSSGRCRPVPTAPATRPDPADRSRTDGT